MRHRKMLLVLSTFHAVVNSIYLIRFFGIAPPEAVVYGYVPWFMSFALPNATFTLMTWLLVFLLIKRLDSRSALVGLVMAGGLIFHALNGLMFGFYTGFLLEITFNAVFEIVVYVYGLALASFYIVQFWRVIAGIAGDEEKALMGSV